MDDIKKEKFLAALDERRKKVGMHIAAERKKKYKSQQGLADAISELTGSTVGQPTVSDWEQGNSIPQYNTLMAMAFLFGCDVGYLLGDYEQRTHNALEIHETIGISEESINYLSFCKTWEFGEIASVIDVLLHDCQFQNSDGRRRYKSVVESMYSFLTYSGTGKRYLATRLGELCEDKAKDGSVPVGATSLDDTMIENAILVEIQNSLHSLKWRLKNG